MKKLAVLSLMAVAIMLCSFTSKARKFSQKTDSLASNPFMTKSTLPLQAPDFAKIKNEDFKPAIEEGIKRQAAEIEQIVNNPAPPTFKNTLVAMEKSGELLNRVSLVFGLFTSANTNPQIQKVQQEEAPKLAASNDAIYLNSKLFKRIETIYKKRASLKLDAESERLISFYYQRFVLAGANLSDAKKTEIKKLNSEEASLRTKFTAKLLAGTKAGGLLITNKDELAGLSQGALDAYAQAAKVKGLSGWLIALQNTTQQPDLQSLTNRETRKRLFDASWNRTEKSDSNDTRAIIVRLAQLRAQKASIMGFASFAAWKLQDQMAKTPDAVDAFLNKLVPAATARAVKEAADLQSVIDQQNGGFKLEPWDWNFYAEQLRKSKYDLDQNEVKPYFELNNVLQNGVFYAANLLYGVTFKERHDLPVYQPDVRVFDVFDKDGSQLGLFYCDYFKRDNKAGGAWMSELVGQSKLLGTRPVIYNVCNFTKPAPGQPALISFNDAIGMFHEFGHGLHGLFASQIYPSLSSPKVARDFVEFPSQFNEHWASDPKILKHYAIHYQTGAPMPQALVDKIKKAANFNKGYTLTELLTAQVLDMKWHGLKVTDPLQDADQFQTAALHQTKLDLPQVPSRYRSSYFLHIWANGYASGYYAYSWTKMLDDDAFSWFEEHGGLTRANGQRFRDMILSRGNTEDLGKMFKAFRGHDPDIHPMLLDDGLVDK